jgi:hypothetical protein
MNPEYKMIYVAFGPLHAETIKLMLEAAGFHVITRQESAGIVYGLTVGSLGEVQILVPEDEASDARKMVEDMDAGRLSGVDIKDDENQNDEDEDKNSDSD